MGKSKGGGGGGEKKVFLTLTSNMSNTLRINMHQVSSINSMHSRSYHQDKIKGNNNIILRFTLCARLNTLIKMIRTELYTKMLLWVIYLVDKEGGCT